SERRPHMISTRSPIMSKRISTLALVVFLTSWSVLTVAQTNSTQSLSDAPTTPAKNASPVKDNHDKSCPADRIGAKKKARKKIKHDAQPSPSKEEQQEAEKMLLGIFG